MSLCPSPSGNGHAGDHGHQDQQAIAGHHLTVAKLAWNACGTASRACLILSTPLLMLHSVVSLVCLVPGHCRRATVA